MKLYYHKTDGGAEYLINTWVRNPDGSKEGRVTAKTKYLVRIDCNIHKDAELIAYSAPDTNIPVKGYEYWDSHPDYPHADWRYEVCAGETLLGYWSWVRAKLAGG
jgi:hypothetical protein